MVTKGIPRQSGKIFQTHYLLLFRGSQLPKHFEAEARACPVESPCEVLQLVSGRTLLGTVTMPPATQLLEGIYVCQCRQNCERRLQRHPQGFPVHFKIQILSVLWSSSLKLFLKLQALLWPCMDVAIPSLICLLIPPFASPFRIQSSIA